MAMTGLSRLASVCAAAALFALLAGCGDNGASDAVAPDTQLPDGGADADSDASGDAQPDAEGPADTGDGNPDSADVDDANDANDADDDADAPEQDTPPEPLSVSFPQALGGAAFANPDLYPILPVRVAATGAPDGVTVGVRGADAAAAQLGEDGQWRAAIAVDRLGEGRIDLVATATRGDETVEAVIDLHLGGKGVRVTDYEAVGAGLTPHVHTLGESVVLTWTDRSADGAARAWLQPLNGAGQLVEDRVQLTPDDHQAIYARTALGDGVVCVLYQRVVEDTPFVNEFRVVNLDGEVIQESVGLNPGDRFGSYGGAVAWDGSGCVMTYRVNNGSASGELYWRRWDKETGLGIAVQLAASGDNDPHGGFNPISFIGIAATPQHSMVTFVRQYWNPSLETRVDRAQLRVMSPDGGFVHRGFIGRERSFHWHQEIHAARIGRALVPIWVEQSLTDPDPNPATVLQAGILDPNNPPVDGMTGHALVDAPQNRGEPVLIEHSDHFGVLAWTDERSYVDPLAGTIQLYFEPVDNRLGRLTTGDESIIRHARFIAGTAHIRGREHGGNILLVWTDERHGNGIFDPRPEIWFEMLWF